MQEKGARAAPGLAERVLCGPPSVVSVTVLPTSQGALGGALFVPGSYTPGTTHGLGPAVGASWRSEGLSQHLLQGWQALRSAPELGETCTVLLEQQASDKGLAPPRRSLATTSVPTMHRFPSLRGQSGGSGEKGIRLRRTLGRQVCAHPLTPHSFLPGRSLSPRMSAPSGGALGMRTVGSSPSLEELTVPW